MRVKKGGGGEGGRRTMPSARRRRLVGFLSAASMALSRARLRPVAFLVRCSGSRYIESYGYIRSSGVKASSFSSGLPFLSLTFSVLLSVPSTAAFGFLFLFPSISCPPLKSSSSLSFRFRLFFTFSRLPSFFFFFVTSPSAPSSRFRL